MRPAARSTAHGDAALAGAGEFQSPALEQLVRVLQQLPGLGRKSATRIALHLLDDADHAGRLTGLIQAALAQVTRCGDCGAITEVDPCAICTGATRDAGLLCVVASPVDILPFERGGFYRGRYFVLGRLLSPLDGVRAEDLPFDRLLQRLAAGPVREVILALDTSVEGETTALYLQRLLAGRPLQLTRLATGIPVGGALAYTDEATLQRAFRHRQGIDGP